MSQLKIYLSHDLHIFIDRVHQKIMKMASNVIVPRPKLHIHITFYCFFKNGPIPASFCFFCAFLITISIIPIEKSLTGVLGIRTHCCMMVDTDDTTELRRPPSTFIVSLPGIFRVAQYIIIPIQDFLRQNLEYLDFHLSWNSKNVPFKSKKHCFWHFCAGSVIRTNLFPFLNLVET